MSLINEALKKAQRARTGDSTEVAPLPGGRVTKRAQPRTAQQLVLIAAGGIVLVVLSVIATVYLLNREPEPKPAAPKAATPAPTPTTAPAPVVVPSLTKQPTTATTPASTPSPAPVPVASPPAATPLPQPTAPAPVQSLPTAAQSPATTTAAYVPAPVPTAPAAATPVVTTPAVAPAPIPAAPPKPDERVAQYIDTLRITAIRATEGRVLMNDRVYRINDIVERTWGLRLIKVEPGILTFSDATGAVYVRNL